MSHKRTFFKLSKSFLLVHPISFVIAVAFFVVLVGFGFKDNLAHAAATTCYWVGDTSPAAWNDATHWSSANGGAGSTCDGGIVPGSDDTATFTSSNTNSANIDVAVNVRGIAMNAGYTGTISQDAGQTVAIGTNGLVQAAGTYSATENITITGGPFTKTGGTYSEGTGIITFAGAASAISANTQTFNNFNINKTSGVALTNGAATSITVNGTLTLTNGTLAGATSTVNAKGTVVQEAGFDGGTGKLALNAAGAQTFTINGGVGPDTTLNNANLNVTPAATCSFSSLTLTAGTFNGSTVDVTIGTVFYVNGGTFNADTGTMIFSGSSAHTLNANTQVFNNLTFSTSGGWWTTVTAATSITVNGTLSLSVGYTGSGTINAKGTVVQSATWVGGTTSVILNAAGAQTYTINGGTAPRMTFNNANLNVTPAADCYFTYLTLTAGAFNLSTRTVTISDTLTVNGGTLNTDTGTFIFTGTGDSMTADGQVFNNLTVNLSAGAVLTITAGNSITVNGIFAMTRGDLRGGTINAKGPVTQGASFNGKTTSVILNGVGAQAYTINGGTAPEVTFNNADLNVTPLANCGFEALTLTAGAFNSSTFTISFPYGGGITTNGGTFNADTGTVSFTNASAFSYIINADNIIFNNLTLNHVSTSTTITAGTSIRVNGLLTLTDGTLGTGSANIAGSLFIASTWDRGNAPFNFVGVALQTLDGTYVYSTSWTSGQVTVKSGASVVTPANTTITTLTIDAGGTFSAADYTFTSTTFINNGTFKLSGDKAVTTPTHGAGSIVEYIATSASRNIQNWTYKGLKINGVGGTFTLPGTITVEEGVNITNGIFDLGANTINVGGNWEYNSGMFTANMSTVNLYSTTTATVKGSSTFYNLTLDATAAGAKQINFTAGSTQTIGNTFSLTGAIGKVLTLRSTTPSSPWYFVIPGAVTSGTYINVQDSQNITNANRITPGANVVSSGNNNPGWTFIPATPTIVAPTAASATSISWNFTDNASNEDGFRVYDASNNLVATCATPDINHCDETGLSVNTAYSGRYVVAYNTEADSPASGTAATIYTLADTVPAPGVSSTYGSSDRLTVVVDASDNPAPTQFAIYNSTLGKFVQANGSNGDSEAWQTRVQWGGDSGVLNTGLTAATEYTYQVKPRNGDNVERVLGPTNSATTPGAGSTITGSLYSDLGITKIGAAKTIKVSVNGLLPASVSTAGGDFTLIANEPIDANDVVVIYVSGDSVKGSVVTKVSAAGNLNTINIYQSYTILRHEGDIAAMTNAILAVADGYYGADSDSLFLVNGSNKATFNQGIYILGSKTYNPGGDVALSGSWNSAGNFVNTDTTVNFNATTAGKTITSSGQSFNHLVFDGVGGEWTNQDGMIVSGNCTLTHGTVDYGTTKLTLNGTGGQTITTGGSAFHDLDITNASVAGVSFLDTLLVDGILKNNTATATMKFKDSVSHSIHTLDLLGTDGVANSVKLRSLSSGVQFSLTYTDITNADYLDIQDANNTGAIISVAHAKDSGNNTNWYLTDAYLTTTHTPQGSGNGWSENLTAKDYYDNATTSDSATVVTLTSTSPTLKFYTDSTYATQTTTYTLLNSAQTIYLKDDSVNDETVRYTVTDAYTKSVQSNDILVSNEPPVSVITSPVSGAILGAGTAQFLGTASDPLGGVVGKVEIQVNSGDWQEATNTGTNYSTWAFDQIFSANGVYVVKTRATDSLGLVETPDDGISIEAQGISISVDTDLPSGTIAKPVQNEWINTATYEITGTATDSGLTPVNKVQISTDGTNWLDATDTGTSFSTWTYAWSNYQDQKELIIYARAIDTINNISQNYQVKIGVDTTAPTKPGNLTAYDVSDRLSGKYQALVLWQPSEDVTSGLKEYQVFRGAEKIATVTDPWYLDEKVSNAKYEYHVVAIDNAANSINSDTTSTELASDSTYQTSISDVAATPSKLISSKNKTTTMITWKTDKPATNQVDYGLGGAKALNAGTSNKLNMGHNVILTNLEPNTTYHYQVTSKDMYGKVVKSGDLTFKTNLAPVKESIIDIIWKTLQKSFQWFSKVMAAPVLEKIGLIKSPDQVTPNMMVFDVSNDTAKTYAGFIVTSKTGGMTVERSVAGGGFITLATTDKSYYYDQNLDKGQKYSYRVAGLDGAASLTPGTADTSAPVITDIKGVEIGVNKDNSEVLITWQTDKLATSSLNINSRDIKDESLNQEHAVTISSLQPNQTYHYKLTSTAEQGGSVVSPDQTLTTSTAPAEDSIWTIIIKTLQKSFNVFSKWMMT